MCCAVNETPALPHTLTSNRDMGQLFQRSLEYEFPGSLNNEHQGFLIVNGNSANTGKRWSEDNFDLLQYRPKDDVSKRPGYVNPYAATE
jgi:hypothetical protein